jgi:hypothetical protein
MAHEPRVVAELGRPETPQETADRKADARATRRRNQTATNLVIATIASLLIALFFGVLMSDTSGEGEVDVVDYATVAEQAQPGVSGATLAVPELPAGWRANRAEIQRGADGVVAWRIGFVTPDNRYLGLLQGVDANATWTLSQFEDAGVTGELDAGGATWTVHGMLGETEALRGAGLDTTVGSSTYVLFGTASEAEFTELADAVLATADPDAEEAQ